MEVEVKWKWKWEEWKCKWKFLGNLKLGTYTSTYTNFPNFYKKVEVWYQVLST